MNLYRLDTGNLGEWYVIANDPTAAENRLREVLNAADYGWAGQRRVKRIDLLATAADTPMYLTDHRLITEDRPHIPEAS